MNFLGPLCADSQSGFLGLFDLSIAPTFLYYSYIPIILVSAFVGLFIFFKDKKSLKNRLLLTFTSFFVLWVLNILVQWVGIYNSIVMFSWQLTAFFEVGMFMSMAYFAYVFLYDRDVSFPAKMFMFFISIATLVSIPMSINVGAYDLANCEGTNGILWKIIYSLEPIIILLIIWWGVMAYREKKETAVRHQIILFTIGTALLLTTFFVSNYYGELTKIYEFNFWGPAGMGIFLVLLGYLIVRYQVFNIKLFATQALVIGIAVLIGARIFYSTTTGGSILSALTFLAFLVSGAFLIKSVQKEIQQREHIEKLANELKAANERQEVLIHFIGHEVKASLTKDSGVFASLSEGDLGPLPDPMKQFVDHALAETRSGVDAVANILKASNLKKGTVTYTKTPFDFKPLVAEAVARAKTTAEQKGLKLSFTADESQRYQVNGDKVQINDHVLRNLIDNAINYTPSGSVEVSLKKENGKVIFAVKDSGVGITDEDKKLLFTEGGHGKDSQKVNVHSTGYGLFIAKQITEAHGGTIHAESEGAGKGSTFIVELPAAQ